MAMLNDITFGQYYPSDSIVHKMDPRYKLVLTFAFIIILFMINSLAGYIIATIYIATAIYISKIPVKLLFKNLKPLWFIMIFMFIINILFYQTGNILIQFWIIK